MAITAVDPVSDSSMYAEILRLETLGFEAVPANIAMQDGGWMIRISPDYAAKRVNSINPVDPNDAKDIKTRLADISSEFSRAGRQIVLRQTPLCSPALISELRDKRWQSFDESLVMMMSLANENEFSAYPKLQQLDIETWVDAFLRLSGNSPGQEEGFATMLDSVQQAQAFFVLMDKDVPIAAGRCVIDGDHAGLFDLVTDISLRGRGFGRQLTGGILRWAITQGCSQAWLQVVAGNLEAVSLYRNFGFEEVYRYCYWSPPERVEKTHE